MAVGHRRGCRTAKARKYAALLVRAKEAHSKDESLHMRLKAIAWAIEDIEQLRLKTIHKCMRTLKVLNRRQKWLANQLEEDLMAIEKKGKR